MRIKITQKHIDKGSRRSTVGCPIALAINEQLNPYPTALVGTIGNRKLATISAGPYKYLNSHRAYQFIHDFDQGRPVEPFTLILRIRK